MEHVDPGELARAKRRRDELMDRMAAMDPDAIDEMQEFLDSLPTAILMRLREEAPHG